MTQKDLGEMMIDGHEALGQALRNWKTWLELNRFWRLGVYLIASHGI
jgi:hypothetical protein